MDCAAECVGKEGAALLSCELSHKALDAVSVLLLSYPAATLTALIFAGSSFMLLRKAEARKAVSVWVEGKKISSSDGGYLLAMTFFDRDLRLVASEVYELVHMDRVRSATQAKDRFEHILQKTKTRTVEALESLLEEDLARKVTQELATLYHFWLSSLVDEWQEHDQPSATPGWMRGLEYTYVMTVHLEKTREALKKTLKNKG